MIKLLKYELKCLLRILKPIYFCFIFLTIAASLILFFISKNESLTSISVFINIMMYIVIIGFAASTMFVPVMRFFRSMVKNEAYQTFSLPVDMKSILFTKLLIAVANNIVSILLILFSAYSISEKGSFSISISDNRFLLYGEVIECNFILLILLIFVLLASSYSMYNLLMFTSISVGQVISKNIVSGSFIAGIILYMLMMIFFVPLIMLVTSFKQEMGNITILFCVVCIAAMSIINLLFFFISNKIFKEKPNLN